MDHCQTRTKYRSGSGMCFYSATATIVDKTVTQEIPTSLETLTRLGAFFVFINEAGSGDAPVSLKTSCGSIAVPIYNPATGLPLLASALADKTTHQITFDKFSGKFFLHP